MPIATRLVTAEWRTPDGKLADGEPIEYRLVPGSYGASSMVQTASIEDTTSEAGQTATALWVNADGYTPTRWIVTTPAGEQLDFLIPPGSTPISLTALLELKETYPVGLPDSDYEDDEILKGDIFGTLANTTDETLGDAMIGYRNTATGAVGRTVHDKLDETRDLLDFGAVGDGVTNDTTAFQAAAAWLNAAGGGTLIVPQRTYIVGRQDPVTLAGEDAFHVTGCTRPVIILGNGAVIRTAAGLKLGDPVFTETRQVATAYTVGQIAAPAIRNGYKYRVVTAGTSYATRTPVWSVTAGALVMDGTVTWINDGPLARAAPGLQFHFTENRASIVVRDVEFDGSFDELVYPSGSIEVSSEGLFSFNNTGGVLWDNVYSHHHARDGFYIGDGNDLREEYPIWQANTVYPAYMVITGTAQTGAGLSEMGSHYRATVGGTSGATQPTWPTAPGQTVVDGTVTWSYRAPNYPNTQHTMINCRATHNGRQGLSHTGGIGFLAQGCDFSQTGASTTWTPPGAGVDIEPNESVSRNLLFIDCTIDNNRGVGFIAVGHRFIDGQLRVADVTLLRCRLWGTQSYSIYPSAARFKMVDCTIYGTTGPAYTGVITKWATRVVWLASTAYALAARTSPVTPNGSTYEVKTAGTSGLAEPTWPLTAGAEVTDGTVTWFNVGAEAEMPIGTIRIPTVANKSRYRAVQDGVIGATEPTWPSAVGATVTDGTVIWRNDGPDVELGDTTIYDHCHLEDLEYPGVGVYRLTALLRAWTGNAAIFRNGTIRVNNSGASIYAVYMIGESVDRRGVLENSTIMHLDITPPGNIASLIQYTRLSNVRFVEAPNMPIDKYITILNVEIGPNVVVEGPNVHWMNPSVPVGLIPRTDITGLGMSSGTAAPSTGPQVVGNIRWNTAPTVVRSISHWVCTSAGTPGGWRAVGMGYGTTAARPDGTVLGLLDSGYTYWDITEAKLKYWNGSAWL